MAGQKIRIKLKAYDHNLIDLSAEKIVETVKKTGTKVSAQRTSIRTAANSLSLERTNA